MSIAVLTLATLCFLLATLLVLAHRVLHVDEDPRIEAVLVAGRRMPTVRSSLSSSARPSST